MIRLAIRWSVFDGVANPTPALEPELVRLDLVVQAEHVSVGVEQRAAGVAGVDRRVRLDRVGDRVVVRRRDAAPDLADDPLRGRLGKAEGAADRDDGVADLRAGGVRERDRMKLEAGTLTWITATSVEGSVPTTFAGTFWPSWKVTVTLAAPATTCSSVRMSPLLL